MRLLNYPQVWLALLAALSLLTGRLWPAGPAPGAAGVLVIAGLGLMGWAGLTMLRAGVTVDPTRPPTGLVTHGPFRWSRNPIYLADAVIMAGLGLLWHPPTAPVLVAALVWVLTRFIRREEAWLAERHGAAFAAWSARTRRWL